MKIQLIKNIALYAIGIIIFDYICTKASDRIDTEKYRYEQKLGRKFYIKNESFEIVDYSIVRHYFTLSNGSKVDSYIVFTDKLK